MHVMVLTRLNIKGNRPRQPLQLVKTSNNHYLVHKTQEVALDEHFTHNSTLLATIYSLLPVISVKNANV